MATEALLRVEKLPHHIWEPACGRGRITNILRAHGHTVWATDLNDYGCPTSESRIDFLMEHQRRFDVEAIVTNPPFKLAEQFVEHALYHCPRVIMLLRLAFYESARRSHILEGTRAGADTRLPQAPSHDAPRWLGGAEGQLGMAFAWFVWDRSYIGLPTTIHRISWEMRDDDLQGVPQERLVDTIRAWTDRSMDTQRRSHAETLMATWHKNKNNYEPTEEMAKRVTESGRSH